MTPQMTPLKDSPVMELLRKASDSAAAWRGLARQYYERHHSQSRDSGQPDCECPVCYAYEQRVAGEAQEAKR